MMTAKQWLGHYRKSVKPELDLIATIKTGSGLYEHGIPGIDEVDRMLHLGP